MNPICLGLTKVYNSPFNSLGAKSGDIYSFVSLTLHWRLIVGRLIALASSVGTGGKALVDVRFADPTGTFGLITKF
jgi:hypothetical protein